MLSCLLLLLATLSNPVIVLFQYCEDNHRIPQCADLGLPNLLGGDSSASLSVSFHDCRRDTMPVGDTTVHIVALKSELLMFPCAP